MTRMAALKHLGPLSAYTAYIFVAGSLKDAGPPGGLSDKVAHFIGFGLMVPLAILAVGYRSPRLSALARTAVAVAVSSSLGALLEVWQMLLPWRSAEFLDWAADTAGALAIGAVALLFRKAFERVPPRAVRE